MDDLDVWLLLLQFGFYLLGVPFDLGLVRLQRHFDLVVVEYVVDHPSLEVVCVVSLWLLLLLGLSLVTIFRRTGFSLVISWRRVGFFLLFDHRLQDNTLELFLRFLVGLFVLADALLHLKVALKRVCMARVS